MGTLNITQAVQYTVGTQSVTIGSLTTPVQLAFASDLVCQRTISVANNTSAILLTIGAAGDISSIVGCVITADKKVGISLEGAAAANNSTFILGAGQYVVLTDSKIYTYDAAGNFTSAATTAIDTIRVDNDALGTAVTVRIWAFA